jgi:hypothetical protein
VPTAEQLAARAEELIGGRAEDAEGLRAVARALGVAEDAYAGATEGGERVPTAEQLAARAEGLLCEPWALVGGVEAGCAVEVLRRLDLAVGEVDIHVEGLSGGWWDVAGVSRWGLGLRCVDGLCAAVEMAQFELSEIADNAKAFHDELAVVERNNTEARETVTAALEKLRAGLGDEELFLSDDCSPPSSRGSTVCGPLLASLRELTSEVSEVSLTLRRVKVVLEEHNAEERAQPESMDGIISASADGDKEKEGRVVSYQDVVAGVSAKVEALRKERSRRLLMERALRGVMEVVATRTTKRGGPSSSSAPLRKSSLLRSLQPKSKPSAAADAGALPGEVHLSHVCASSIEEAESGSSLSCTGDYEQEVLAAFQQVDDVARVMRGAVVRSYGALGGDENLSSASDTDAAAKLADLATVTGESIEAVRALLLPDDGDTSKRVPLSALLEGLKAKLSTDPAAFPTNVVTALEEAARASAFKEVAKSSRLSTASSLVRHVAPKRKPSPPERAKTENFALRKLVRSHSCSVLLPWSTSSTLKVLPPPPQGRPLTTAAFEKQYAYKLAELDALRRGCALALGLLDPSEVSKKDLESNELIVELVLRCSGVQSAMEAVHPLFDPVGMTDELRAALTGHQDTNRDAREGEFPTQCIALVRAFKALKNTCDEMRLSRSNMAKQQKFLIENEQQNTRELREALAEVKEELQQSRENREALQRGVHDAEERAAGLELALQAAEREAADLRQEQVDATQTLAVVQQQQSDAAGALAAAQERIGVLSDTCATLETAVREAVDTLQNEAAEAEDALHWCVLGTRWSPPQAPAGSELHELLRLVLRDTVDGLRSCTARLQNVSAEGKGIAAVMTEQQATTAEHIAALTKEVAALTVAHGQAEVQLQEATRQLQCANSVHADEVHRLQQELRNQEAAEHERALAHQRMLRQLQDAAAEELEGVQKRLERVSRACRDEEAARLETEGVNRGLQSALADVEANLARQQHRAAKEAAVQLESTARRIDALEKDLADARERNTSLTNQLARAAEEAASAKRLLRVEEQKGMDRCAALATAEEQLRLARGELAEVRILLAKALSLQHGSPLPGGGRKPVTRASVLDMLVDHLRYVKELQRCVDTRFATERERRSEVVQSDDAVAETLAAFQALWATAVEAQLTPANLKEEWHTPADKAEVLQNVLKRDFTPQLTDLAAARRLLIEYMSRPAVRRYVRTAATPATPPAALDTASTALLVQLYHNAVHDAHDAQVAGLEKEVREGRRAIEAGQQLLRELEEQHEREVVEVELHIGHMREMVQNKLLADEVTEQQARETEAAMEAHLAQLHAYAAERADMVRHVQELRRLIRRKLRGKST